jgi:micrococcal nuclease
MGNCFFVNKHAHARENERDILNHPHPQNTKTKEIEIEIETTKIPIFEECIEFNYDQIIRDPVYCVRVYDGDTITIASQHISTGKWIKYQLRINAIDCPELRTKNQNEKYTAEIARDLTSSLVLGKRIYLKNIEKEKYGRVLAEVYVNTLNIGEELVKNRLAVPYNGGTKKVPEDWKTFYEGQKN